MNKVVDVEKTRFPAIKVIKVDNNHIIHIDDQIFGKLVVNLIKDNGDGFVEGCEIKIPDFSGEYGCSITVPKAWVNKKVFVKYEREVIAKVIKCSSKEWSKYMKDMKAGTFTNNFTIDGLTFDFPYEGKVFYHIYFTE